MNNACTFRNANYCTEMNYFRTIAVLIILALLMLVVGTRNARQARIRSYATSTVGEVRMIESAAEQYAIENGLKKEMTVDFDSLVAAGYFDSMKDSRLNRGQHRRVDLPIQSTYGVVYHAIPHGQRLTVHMIYRELFTPKIETTDTLWSN